MCPSPVPWQVELKERDAAAPPFPGWQARLSILEIHTREWRPAPSPALLSELAARCTGYCGADIKALCSEAALVALRRSFPQIYASKEKLQLNIDAVQVPLFGGRFATGSACLDPVLQ